MKGRARPALGLVLLALAAGWLALAPPAAAKKLTTWTVDMTPAPPFRFEPANLTIAEGDTVTWVHRGTGAPHTTTSGVKGAPNAGQLWDSGRLTSGTFSRTFTEEGTYPYFCAVGLHAESGMVGTITVVDKLKKAKKPK
jgi:plastocyanin